MMSGAHNELSQPHRSIGESTAHEQDESRDSDAVLAAERAHLLLSRECLHQMRENVLSLKALGGDRVSEEYLKADLYRRAEALLDIPDLPLFFGRIDYVGPPAERLHIGRRHVHDSQGRAMVIDWRAPLSIPFYRATFADPMGLALRRRFGFSAGELTAYEDEDFTVALTKAQETAITSRILVEEIERPRVGPMRDIVATIQPDQDDIVRADVGKTFGVQGAPGTGKTAVGLHRVAYLLYTYPERMRRGGVLVVGPNRAFLSYIREVLPTLGEMSVKQVTVTELVSSAIPLRVRAKLGVSGMRRKTADYDKAARIKGDIRMAEVLHRALWSHLATPTETLVVPRGTRRWRVHPYEIEELMTELRERGVRYGTARDLLAHRLAHVILTQMEEAGEACDDRTHDSVRRSRPVKAIVDAIWPSTKPLQLVMHILSDPEFLSKAADGILSLAEQEALLWSAPPKSPQSAPWSAADAVLVDEATDLIERTRSLNHVVVDEAQDLSPMECRAIGRRCTTGSATLLGDIAQGTTPWASSDWSALLSYLGKPTAEIQVLETGYRVPRQIIDYASKLLPYIAPELTPARSIRQSPGSLEIVNADAKHLRKRLVELSRKTLLEPGSVGVIAADDDVAALASSLSRAGLPHLLLGADLEFSTEAGDSANDPRARLTVIPVSLAKGLEFDHVVVVEPARIIGDSAEVGLRRLYVALTRAVSRLFVLHAEPLPPPLR